MTKTIKIGKNQRAFLRAMVDSEGTFYFGCGWIWGNRSESLKIVKSLVKRGCVSEEKHKTGRISYRITDLGRKLAS